MVETGPGVEAARGISPLVEAAEDAREERSDAPGT